MIKNIIFDIGNVLVNYRPWEYLEERYSREEAEFLLPAVFGSREWVELDAGTISEEEAVARMVARNPEREGMLRAVMGDITTLFTPIESSIAVLKQLKQAGYRILYLSNISHGILEFIRTAYDFLDFCDGGVASAQIRQLKPDAQIYQHLIGQYAIKPGESLFIDDTDRNIMAAGELGFRTIHLTDPSDLRRQLQLAGISYAKLY